MIPCYWENTPSGCLKPHCAFQHSKPRPTLKSAVERVREIKEVENQGEYGVSCLVILFGVRIWQIILSCCRQKYFDKSSIYQIRLFHHAIVIPTCTICFVSYSSYTNLHYVLLVGMCLVY